MDSNTILQSAKDKFTKAQDHFREELKKVRTGRATPSMLDNVKVEAYGTSMPLNQVATVSAPEPQLLQLTPFDPTNLQAIALAIRSDEGLGLNPVDDGRVIRISIPPLTTERRQQIAKQLGTKVEEALVKMRQARHEAIKEADQSKKSKTLSEDDISRLQKQIDEALQQNKTALEELAKQKEIDIMTV